MTPPDLADLDFTEFHPLDHPVTHCEGYPGGRPRHVALWLRYGGLPCTVRTYLHLPRCLLGLHTWDEVWTSTDQGYQNHMACRWCGARDATL